MKSLLFQGATPFTEPPGCVAVPCRTEVPVSIRKNGRIYRITLRDRVVPEDPYLVMLKAQAFAISQGEPYVGRAPSRAVRDFLIKDTVVV
jgi:hypothetical protein